MLSWAFCASPERFPAHRRTGFPALAFLRFVTPGLRRVSSGRRSKALTSLRVEPPLAGRPDSLEVFHQDLPSGSPDDSGVLSDGSERIWSTPCAAHPIRRPDSPSEEDARVHSEECSRGRAPLVRPGELPPRGASLLHHFVKENRQRVGPFGAVLPRPNARIVSL
jgi:hypothetical protein